MEFSVFSEQLGLETEEYFQLVELFLEVSNTDLNVLEGAFEKGDPKQVTEAAHSIKGAAINLGLKEISDIAKGIEMRARENNVEGAIEDAGRIREKLNNISDCLRETG